VLQFSGANFENPLINTVPRAVSGNFANRNHIALLLAIGSVLALAWAFRPKSSPWKAGAAFGLLVIFILVTLASGSRSGAIVGLSAIVLTFIVFRAGVTRQLEAIPRKVAIPLVALAVALTIAAVWLSVSLDRAASIDRATMLQGDADLRLKIWPIVLDMIQRYFPLGTGFGTFDPVFRISEPDAILAPSYINLAHNDWLQILLEGGLISVALLGATLAWLIFGTFRLWYSDHGLSNSRILAKAGSIVIALVCAASITDYPARTPMLMALLALAAVWLVKDRSNNMNTSLIRSRMI